MKRFWKHAEIVAAGEGHGIELDGRPVKLPNGKPLTTHLHPLAEAIAAEWAGAPRDFSPDDLPLTRLASTAQERITPQRPDIIHQLAAYGMNDLLCYRAEAPDELANRQMERWDPWLKWAEDRYGLRLLRTTGLIPINQPPDILEHMSQILSAYSDDTIAALGVIVPALGSLILGLALSARAISPEAACETAFLDELWQEEKWGLDDEALTRRAKLIEDVTVSTRFMYLCCP